MLKRKVYIFLIFFSIVFLSGVSWAKTPVVVDLNYQAYQDKGMVAFKFDQSVNMVFYTVDDPPQIIADTIGSIFASGSDIKEVIPINQGAIKRIKVFKDSTLGERFTKDGKCLYGIDFFIVELNEMVPFLVDKQDNAYYLYVAKSKGITLAKERIRGTKLKEEETVILKESFKDKKVTEQKSKEHKIIEMTDYQQARHWREVGYKCQKTNNFDKAVKSYKKAIIFDPDYACAHNDLGIVYFYVDKLKDSINEFERVLEINPDYQGAYTNLAIAYEKLGNIDEAIKYWQKRIDLTKKEDYWSKKAKRKIKELKNK